VLLYSHGYGGSPLTDNYLRALVAFLRGDYASAAAIAGAITQDEEVESELEGLGVRRAEADARDRR
jgi:hypothetical protein